MEAQQGQRAVFKYLKGCHVEEGAGLFCGVTAVSSGTWAEGEEAVVTFRAVQGQKVWPKEPTEPHPAR